MHKQLTLIETENASWQATDTNKEAVIGGGTMGSGIAEVAAKSGCETIVVEIDASIAEQAQK